ncbi:hypothetical protein ASY01nite_19540 [Acetobacter syzygii]|nr:hypothetical protein Absy_022_073 [Acetobacter syzygii]GEL56888.1 hypothetical protein ASY01nite_19540 [Acetobacter syzygii]
MAVCVDMRPSIPPAQLYGTGRMFCITAPINLHCHTPDRGKALNRSGTQHYPATDVAPARLEHNKIKP